MKHPIIVAAINDAHRVEMAILCDTSQKLAMQFVNCLTAPVNQNIRYMIIVRSPPLGKIMPRDMITAFCQGAADLWATGDKNDPVMFVDKTAFYRIDL